MGYGGRSSWRGKALLVCSAVAMVALLCLVGFDGSNSRASLSYSASSEDNNGGTSGETAHKGDASDFIDTADLGDYVDAIIGPAPSGLTDGGYKKRGSLAVSKIDAAGFYYLNIEGEPGHALKCILQVWGLPLLLSLSPPLSLLPPFSPTRRPAGR